MKRVQHNAWWRIAAFTAVFTVASLPDPASVMAQMRLPGTSELEWNDDIAARLVAGVDRFLLTELEQSVAGRATFWNRDFRSRDRYSDSLAPNRQRLARILGVRDARHPADALWLVGTTDRSPVVAENQDVQVLAVRWPVVGSIFGEGLLLVPRHAPPVADIVAVPDADQTPEAICGLIAGVERSSQFARLLAESGCRVLVPSLVDRRLEARNGRAVLTNREYLYRSSFELGRHLIGYEVQKILAGVDWFEHEARDREAVVGVVGWGEGGMLAIYAAALDTRIDAACVSGYFEPRERIWQQPIDRNVFGLLEQFGDAELASMVAPRSLLIEAAQGPECELPPGKGGAPARLATPELTRVQAEFERARDLVANLPGDSTLELVVSEEGQGPFLTEPTLQEFLKTLVASRVQPSGEPRQPALGAEALGAEAPSAAALRDEQGDSDTGDADTGDVDTPDVDRRKRTDTAQLIYRGDNAGLLRRAAGQRQQIDAHNEWLLRESPYERAEYWKELDTSSLEAYGKSIAQYRAQFREEVIGQFAQPLLPANVRSRQSYASESWIGYEVVMDVFPDVFAYGILLLPKDLQPGERRPVVVCQHGLEGRPQQLIEGDHRAYHDFAARLAERGFITFSPQNLYIFGDRFRTLQRKANPLKKTLFSIMVPQHQQIVNWLAKLDCVDPERIGFYGLSYGGKSAMRIPPLVDGYCLSICSGDFNEWVWKNASNRSKYSYLWTGEYEIFEFDLGSTFNYAEMAALIAPRPFMVERGHFDAVAPDEKVAHEFAKVRRLYAAHLGIPDQCAIEWFNGPHTINGKGTFQFLHRHLKWPPPQ